MKTKYTKTWMISYEYGGFTTSYSKGDTFEEAFEKLKKKVSSSIKYVSHKLYSEYTKR